MSDFRLNTITYGLASSPYLAIRILHQLAVDEGEDLPGAAEALRREVYMDDIVSGAPTLAEARILRNQLQRLCAAGGFPLRKWAANHPALLEDIPLDHRADQGEADWMRDPDRSVLGLCWNSERDSFALAVGAAVPATITKRSLLASTARLFDPLGWVAPIILKAKLLVQTTWLQQLDWDAPLEGEEASSWSGLVNELPLLEEVRVPRWMCGDIPGSRVEIHGFSDAFERGSGLPPLRDR